MKKKIGEKVGQTFSITGDLCHLLSFYVVPNSGEHWIEPKIKEVVQQHQKQEDKFPKFCLFTIIAVMANQRDVDQIMG